MLVRATTVLSLFVTVLVSEGQAQGLPEFHYRDGGHAHGIFFLDGSNGWIAADGGRMHYTIDGGATWPVAQVPLDVRGQLRGVFFLDADNGWAVGDEGIVLRSTDAGRTWAWLNHTSPVMNFLQQPTPAELYDIWMFDDDIGWLVGNDGVWFRTEDGGMTWSWPSGCGTPVFGHDPTDFYDVYFLDADTGVVAADYGKVYRTTDGGCTWTEINLDDVLPLCPGASNLELWSLDFLPAANPSEAVGWLGGGFGTNEEYVFRTEDGGASWTQELPYVGTANPNCAMGTVYGVAALGGPTQQVVTAQYGSVILAKQATSGTAFDPCTCSSVPYTGDALVQVEPFGTPDLSLGIAPPITAVCNVSTTDAWACGRFGILRRRDPGGSNWSDQGTVDYLRLTAGDFVDADVGCVAGDKEIIKKTTTGADAWSTVYAPVLPPGTDPQVFGLALAPTGHGVAVGSQGYFARSVDFGDTWVAGAVPGAPSMLVRAAFVPGTATVYVVGAGGFVARSADGGAGSWTEVSLDPAESETLTDVAFVDASRGYVVGKNQSAFYTDDGGATWTKINVSGGVAGEDFHGVDVWDDPLNDPPLVVVVGTSGLVYSREAGSQSRLLPVDLGSAAVDTNLNAVQIFGDMEKGFVAGDGGVVLHYDGSTWTRPRTWTSENLEALSFDSATHGFVIGQQSAISEWM